MQRKGKSKSYSQRWARYEVHHRGRLTPPLSVVSSAAKGSLLPPWPGCAPPAGGCCRPMPCAGLLCCWAAETPLRIAGATISTISQRLDWGRTASHPRCVSARRHYCSCAHHQNGLTCCYELARTADELVCGLRYLYSTKMKEHGGLATLKT